MGLLLRCTLLSVRSSVRYVYPTPSSATTHVHQVYAVVTHKIYPPSICSRGTHHFLCYEMEYCQNGASLYSVCIQYCYMACVCVCYCVHLLRLSPFAQHKPSSLKPQERNPYDVINKQEVIRREIGSDAPMGGGGGA